MKKAQSAMEYLLTYGWAILIVLVALSALFYLGVFSPSTPNTCQIMAPFVCMDVKGLGAERPTSPGVGSVFEIVIGAEGVTNPGVSEIKVNNLPCDLGSATINVGQTSSIYCHTSNINQLNKGDKFSGTLSLTYTSQYSSLSHSVEGQFSGTMEGCSGAGDCPSCTEVLPFYVQGSPMCVNNECVYSNCGLGPG